MAADTPAEVSPAVAADSPVAEAEASPAVAAAASDMVKYRENLEIKG